MDTAHTAVVLRLGAVGVHYGGTGIPHGGADAVHPAGEVDVLGVHEETRVEAAGAVEGVGAHEHEATVVIGHVKWGVGPSVGEVVAGAAPGEHPFGQECAHKHIPRRGQRMDHILLTPVGEDSVRDELYRIGVGIEVAQARFESAGAEEYIAVDDQMEGGAPLDGAPDSHVMGVAVAGVGVRSIGDARAVTPTEPGGGIVRRIIHDVHTAYLRGSQQRVEALGQLVRVGVVCYD